MDAGAVLSNQNLENSLSDSFSLNIELEEPDETPVSDSNFTKAAAAGLNTNTDTNAIVWSNVVMHLLVSICWFFSGAIGIVVAVFLVILIRDPPFFIVSFVLSTMCLVGSICFTWAAIFRGYHTVRHIKTCGKVLCPI